MVKIPNEDQELQLIDPVPWSKKKGKRIRKMPYTAKSPTPAQQDVRRNFGEKSKEATLATVGLSGTAKVEGLNGEMKDRVTGYKAQPPTEPRLPPVPEPVEKESLPPGLPSINDNREGDEYLKEIEIDD